MGHGIEKLVIVSLITHEIYQRICEVSSRLLTNYITNSTTHLSGCSVSFRQDLQWCFSIESNLSKMKSTIASFWQSISNLSRSLQLPNQRSNNFWADPPTMLRVGQWGRPHHLKVMRYALSLVLKGVFFFAVDGWGILCSNSGPASIRVWSSYQKDSIGHYDMLLWHTGIITSKGSSRVEFLNK